MLKYMKFFTNIHVIKRYFRIKNCQIPLNHHKYHLLKEIIISSLVKTIVHPQKKVKSFMSPFAEGTVPLEKDKYRARNRVRTCKHGGEGRDSKFLVSIIIEPFGLPAEGLSLTASIRVELCSGLAQPFYAPPAWRSRCSVCRHWYASLDRIRRIVHLNIFLRITNLKNAVYQLEACLWREFQAS